MDFLLTLQLPTKTGSRKFKLLFNPQKTLQNRRICFLIISKNF